MPNIGYTKGVLAELIAAAFLTKEGYVVFMSHGRTSIVDIIAIKDKKVHLFDVKSNSNHRALTQDQIDLGVRIINVTDDDKCEIFDSRPAFKWGDQGGPCLACGEMFKANKRDQQFCNRKCRDDHAKAQRV